MGEDISGGVCGRWLQPSARIHLRQEPQRFQPGVRHRERGDIVGQTGRVGRPVHTNRSRAKRAVESLPCFDTLSPGSITSIHSVSSIPNSDDGVVTVARSIRWMSRGSPVDVGLWTNTEVIALKEENAGHSDGELFRSPSQQRRVRSSPVVSSFETGREEAFVDFLRGEEGSRCEYHVLKSPAGGDDGLRSAFRTGDRRRSAPLTDPRRDCTRRRGAFGIDSDSVPARVGRIFGRRRVFSIPDWSVVVFCAFV